MNSRDCNFTNGKIDKRQQQVEENIQRYLSALESADRAERAGLGDKTVQIKEKIAQLRQQLHALDAQEQTIRATFQFLIEAGGGAYKRPIQLCEPVLSQLQLR